MERNKSLKSEELFMGYIMPLYAYIESIDISLHRSLILFIIPLYVYKSGIYNHASIFIKNTCSFYAIKN